jgi:hypothetical protein
MTAIKRRGGSSTLEIAEKMVRALNPVTRSSLRDILIDRVNYAKETSSDSLERQELVELMNGFDITLTFDGDACIGFSHAKTFKPQ